MSVGASLSKSVFVVAARPLTIILFGFCQVLASKAALASIDLDPKHISSVCVGNVLSASGADTPYIARHVALKCGLPLETPALTVNRLCGSGFQSIVNGAQEIILGDSMMVMAGGSDNMSACPYAVRDIRFGTRLGVNPQMEDMMWASLTDAYSNTPMGVTAENLAAKFNVTRQEVDEFALRSQQTWAQAQEKGVFKDEIAPVEIKTRKGVKVMDRDEHPKPETTLEGLAKLPPVFKKDGGVVTAGSASGICDGAGALILAGEEAVKAHGLKPLARIVGYGIAGCEPKIMGYGPVPAIRKMCEKTGISLGQVDQLEINEAFGAQALSCLKDLQYPMEKFNTCGGAIAIGHPLGASGSRISAHMVYKLRQNNEKYGIGSACIGGGQGISILFERV
ncbi:3-ketoacyl-CoA thiolase, mitochondrial-like [Tigriopus californicus]|uniref:3-ketoacyl-CoA thiolase, mitochondrial-like n=1 Tax=Tigriopus californicus TaxID=6832 RepID=UPI0027DA3D73|nr:3-ketoacyl-CoA thiolase, mitochondrial-like [Tigriopus californicus]